MKIYLVGGAVRNELLGLPVKDRDYVVVGSTKEEMLANGYELVGQDFPVFLKNGEEYALARREKSNGGGYHDFEVSFGPDVTLEEDLLRRDFTVNAVAKDLETGEYIDPLGGIKDINERKLRSIHRNTFVDDPVRILRLARFAAQYPAFNICESAILDAALGNVSNATSERVAKELEKALMGARPSNFFNTLKRTGHIWQQFAEVHSLIGQTQKLQYHLEGDAYHHTMMVLDSSAKYNESLEVRFGCLVHDLGKGLTPKDKLPAHIRHEQNGVGPTNNLCDRLKLSNKLRNVGVASAEYHMHLHKITVMKPKTIVKLYNNIKRYYNEISRVGFHDNEGKLPYAPNNNHILFKETMYKLSKVKLSNKFSQDEIDEMSIQKRQNVLNHMMIEAIC